MARELKEGQRAPAFTAESSEGGTVSLEDLKGKAVVLYIYPRDNTSGCTKEACGFRDNMARLETDGVVVLGVSRDSLKSHGNFIEKYDLNFPLLSDPDGKLITAYGAWKVKTVKGEKNKSIDRSTFLIDGEGMLRRIWRKVKVDGHVDEVLAAVRELD